VGVDEAGDDDEAAGVDHLGVGVDLGGDLGDRVPLDEDVARRQVAEVTVHGQDGAATQQEPVGHVLLLDQEQPVSRGSIARVQWR
jgi:hypothetical protein